MNSPKTTDPQKICENILTEQIRYNTERSILPSENAVAHCLLKRSTELKDAYVELYEKLHIHTPALEVFIGLLLNAAAFWNPEKMTGARQARTDLMNVNQKIARKAEELAVLLEQRSELNNTSGFSSNTYCHVCEVIEAAAKDNYLFNSYIQDPLYTLQVRFDLKYWPSLSDFLQALASDAENATLDATDPLTASGTAAKRPSRADFFKVLFTSMDENSAKRYGQLPYGFKLTDKTLASLATCALDLNPDHIVDEAYVKRLRQRERSSAQ